MITKWTQLVMLFVPTIVLLAAITKLCHGNAEEQYIGCYRDGGANNRAMRSNIAGLDNTFNHADMTLEKCLEHGVLARSTYVGILDSYYCFYGESYYRLGKLEDSACDMPCGGNARQKCGGAKAIKVLSVCPLSYYGLHDCSMRCDNCNTNNHLNRSLCSRVAVCVGGCQDGWKGTECNDDKDECNDRTHECEHQCHNTRGSYTCSCRLGFSLDSNNKNCSDNDECQEKTDNCQHHCTNTKGSFICSCREGYRLDSDRKSCNDIDECTEKTNECEQLCNNTEGNYTCSCKDGFALDSNNKNCSDINECSTNNGGCNHECINYEPGFNCSCYTDRYYHYNGTFCEDINECTNTSYGHNGGCHQSCDNAYGNYSCSCLPGFYLESNLKHCSDINECTNARYGERGGCNQICNNAVSTYWCSCLQGYRLQDDNKTCEDINECEQNNGGCDHYCVNHNSGYTCSCQYGYELTSVHQCSAIYGIWPISAIVVTALVSTTLLIVIGGLLSGYFRLSRQLRAIKSDFMRVNACNHHETEIGNIASADTLLYQNVAVYMGNDGKLLKETKGAVDDQRQCEDTVYSIIPESSYEALGARTERRITAETYQELRIMK